MILVSSLVTGFISMRQECHCRSRPAILDTARHCSAAALLYLGADRGDRGRALRCARLHPEGCDRQATAEDAAPGTVGIEHGLRDLCVAGRRQSSIHRAGVRRGAVTTTRFAISLLVIRIGSGRRRNAIVCSIATAFRGSPVCDALTTMWSWPCRPASRCRLKPVRHWAAAGQRPRRSARWCGIPAMTPIA